MAVGAGMLMGGPGAQLALGPALRTVLEGSEPHTVTDIVGMLGTDPARLGVPDPAEALLVPLCFRGRHLGLLAAFDRLTGPHFDPEDVAVLEAFAASASTAVATAQTVGAERLRHSLLAAEEERRRWARELHDETLQGLAGLRMLLAGAAREADPERLRSALARAAEQVASDIDALRAIIADLRPAVLDELGLAPALGGLVERVRTIQGLEVETSIEIGPRRLAPELETVAYRIVQEALTNVAKHARATRAEVEVRVAGDALVIRVADDGIGLPKETPHIANGLVGMRERVGLAGGELAMGVAGHGGGTEVRVSVPLEAPSDATPAAAPRPAA